MLAVAFNAEQLRSGIVFSDANQTVLEGLSSSNKQKKKKKKKCNKSSKEASLTLRLPSVTLGGRRRLILHR
jgi:hypothetical protein